MSNIEPGNTTQLRPRVNINATRSLAIYFRRGCTEVIKLMAEGMGFVTKIVIFCVILALFDYRYRTNLFIMLAQLGAGTLTDSFTACDMRLLERLFVMDTS